MLNQLGIEESEVPKMCLDLYKEYGTTMAGLKVKKSFYSNQTKPKPELTKTEPYVVPQVLGYEFDNDEFHEYVHGRLPYEKLKPDPVLRNLLLSMPHRKIVSFLLLRSSSKLSNPPFSHHPLFLLLLSPQIFTNADKAHATRALNRLGLEECFEGIICFETLNPCSDSKTQKILCKPSVEAFEAAIRIADIVHPRKTVK